MLVVTHNLETSGTVFAEDSNEEDQMKRKREKEQYRLGDLIAALFEETKKVTPDREEQRILVFAALKDLLSRRVHSVHPIAITQ